MDPHLQLAIAGLVLSIIVALGSAAAMIFSGARFVGRIEAVGESFKEARDEVVTLRRGHAEHATAIATQAKELETIKGIQSAQAGALARHDGQLGDLWKKVFSTDKHVAVTRAELRSRPDLIGEE